MAIYVNIKRQRFVKDFITLLYSHSKNGYMTCIESFSDQELTKSQCNKGKYRSIDDILEIVNTYYPSITMKRLAKILHNLEILNNENKTYYFHSLYCSNIEKTTTLFTNFRGSFRDTKKGSSILSAKEFYQLSKL